MAERTGRPSGQPRQVESRKRFVAALVQQKQMLQDKREQIEAILKAIASTEKLLQAGHDDWPAIPSVIGQIQTEHKSGCIRRFSSAEQLRKIDEIQRASYTSEPLKKLQVRAAVAGLDGDTILRHWTVIATEAERLAAEGADPAGPEAQALAQKRGRLLAAFTQGEPEIEAGLLRFWDEHQALPADERHLAALTPPINEAGVRFPAAAVAFEEAQRLDADEALQEKVETHVHRSNYAESS